MSHAIDPNRETLARLQDFLNDPGSKYSPSEIWSDDYMELRPWPFQTGTGREGIFPTTIRSTTDNSLCAAFK